MIINDIEEFMKLASYQYLERVYQLCVGKRKQ